jgi:hypothetical protein
MRITCSAHEFTFLARLLGANSLVGMIDPYIGWLSEEITAAWETARDSLAARGFLAIDANGQVLPNPAVAALIATCAFPDASFILTNSAATGHQEVRYFHCTRHLAIERTEHGAGYQLAALSDAVAIYDRLRTLIAWDNRSAVSSPGGEVAEATLKAARRYAAAGDQPAAEAILQRAGLDASTVTALAQTLAQPKRTASLVAITRRETVWDVTGLGMLDGEHGMWYLRLFPRGRDTRVEIQPCPAKTMAEQVRQVMNRVLPTPLPAGVTAP